MSKSIDELRAELRAAELAEDEAKKSALKSTPIKWKYTVYPVEAERHFHEVYDDTCRLYKIDGAVANLDEAKAAGHPEFNLRGGGMIYVFSNLSKKLIMATGGGTMYISSHSWGNEVREQSAQETADQISEFLAENPDGGDITEIITRHRK
jgi:hypothetical protein